MALRTRSAGMDGFQPRRSTRLRNKITYLEDTESETSIQESLQNQDMMDDDDDVQTTFEHHSLLQHDEVTSEAGSTEVPGLKKCAVVLNRINPEDDSGKKEDDERDDVRKSGKPASRIPTFHSSLAKKRPTGSHSSELAAPSLSRKEAFNQSQTTEKVSSIGDTSRSKLPSIRETSLQLPSVRPAKGNTETSSRASTPEKNTTVLDVTLPDQQKNQSLLSMYQATQQLHPMIVSPRPAIRSESGDHDPELLPDKTQDFTTPDQSLYSSGGSFTQATQQAPEEEVDAQVEMESCLVASSGAEKESFEMVEGDEDENESNLDQAENVEKWYEEPPCEPMNLKLVSEEDDTDSPCEEERPVEKLGIESLPESEVTNRNDDEEKSINKENVSGKCSAVPEGTTDAGTDAAPVPQRTTNTSQSNKTCGWSFLLFCFLPSSLLLIGGFGQHIWHYGIPSSVSNLMVQLELHWLEGFLPQEPCSFDCRVNLVESIPQGLYPTDSTPLPSIAEAWLDLLNKANSSVDIAAFYFSLRDTEPSALQGKEVFKQLMQLESKGVKLQIAVNGPQSATQDTHELAKTGAEVREVDLQSFTGGIIHTKLWVVDQKHFYLGSANMDWRSLTQVKEVGVSVENCSCLAQDASRIFGVYWYIGAQKNGSLPLFWPARYSALSSSDHPLTLKLNGVPARVYLSSAPPQIAAPGRSDDLSTILSVISDAQKYVHISVMDYLPLSQFTEPLRFWPAIDSAIRAAACTRGVEVNLLVSCWQHSPDAMFVFLQSLTTLNAAPLGCNINVKVFEVPSTPEQRKIPFARVNHAKYMVTDRVVYIGTSNWSENYFTNTAGVGLVVNQTGSETREGQRTLQSELQEVFQRDWASEYAQALSNDDVKRCGKKYH